MKFRAIAGLGLAMAALLLAGCESDNAKYNYDPLAQNAAPANSGGMAQNSGAMATTAPMVPAAPADATGTTLHVNDSVTFNFSDTPVELKSIEDTVKEDGTVMLMYNQKFIANGKTIGALQQEIRDFYVPRYYKYLTVTIKPQERFYYVGGEVRSPSRQVYSGSIKLLGAIDTAGGFTEFARKGRVQVTRANGETFNVDCRDALRHPEHNPDIFPGDKINVPKRLL